MIPARVETSATLSLLQKVNARKAAGEDIVSFTAGEPDFDTPDFIVQKAYEAMREGHTRYCPSAGISMLRKATADDYKNRLACNSRENCVSISRRARTPS